MGHHNKPRNQFRHPKHAQTKQVAKVRTIITQNIHTDTGSIDKMLRGGKLRTINKNQQRKDRKERPKC